MEAPSISRSKGEMLKAQSALTSSAAPSSSGSELCVAAAEAEANRLRDLYDGGARELALVLAPALVLARDRALALARVRAPGADDGRLLRATIVIAAVAVGDV